MTTYGRPGATALPAVLDPVLPEREIGARWRGYFRRPCRSGITPGLGAGSGGAPKGSVWLSTLDRLLHLLAPWSVVSSALAVHGSGRGGRGRQARKDREQRARQDVLRVLIRVGEALDYESKIDLERCDAADVDASAAVDRLGEELAVLVTDLPRKDRQRLDLCIEALRERALLGPGSDHVGRRATSTMQQLVTAQLHDEPPKDWISAVLKDFAESLEIVHEMHEESYRAQEEWRHEERERRKAKRERPEDET